MEGNVVKAAWILGGSIVLSVVLSGIGLLVVGLYLSQAFTKEVDRISERTVNAVLQAPRNTQVEVRGSEALPIKVGFEPKLPANIRLENAWDDGRQKRAPLEVEVNPDLKNK